MQGSPKPKITFEGSGGIAPYTFSYRDGNGVNQTVTTTGGSSVTIDAPTEDAGVFIYTLVSVQDASSTTCSNLQNGSAIVTVNPTPDASISGSTTVCQNSVSPEILFSNPQSLPVIITYKIGETGSLSTINVPANSTGKVTASTSSIGIFDYILVSVAYQSAPDCVTPISGNAVITVNPSPIATISGTTTVCQNGNPPEISFANPQDLPIVITYRINSGSTITIEVGPNGESKVAAPTNIAGTFDYQIVSVSYKDGPFCSNPISTQTATVTVNPTPTATISGTTTVCHNSIVAPKITFSNPMVLPVIITYTLDEETKTIAVAGKSSENIDAASNMVGIFNYNLVSVAYQDAPECSNLISGTATITVNPLPTATISTNTEVCLNGANQIVTFTGANGTAPYTFYYNINGGSTKSIISTGDVATLIQTTTSASDYTYNLISVTDNSSTKCTNPLSGLSATVTVHALPVITLDGPSKICLGETNTFSTQDNMNNYQWVFIGGNLAESSVTNSNTITIDWFSTTGTKSISVNYTDENGCMAALPATVSAIGNTDNPSLNVSLYV